jgi:hypothetical protein
MLENFINLIIYIAVHGLGLALGLGLFALLSLTNQYIERINFIIRILMVPVVMLVALIAVAACTNNALALLAIFWNHDASSNIWFYSNIIVPGLTSYVMLWSVYFTVPKFKFIATVVIGGLWIGFYLFIGLMALKTGIGADGNFLYEYFDVDTSIFGTVLLVVSSIVGAYFAIKNSKDGTLEI